MDLKTFVKCLPLDWRLAPIYRKGARMLSGKVSTGKIPFEESQDKTFNRDDALRIIESNPSMGAVGLWTGPKAGGIVILDVDGMLSVYKKKWGNTLDGAPVVRSTKANAAKFIFRVPEALWDEVEGTGLRTHEGIWYEILWKRQGVIYGEYPGSKDGKAPAGHYGFEGDTDSIPDAPDWMIKEMKEAKHPKSLIKNRHALNVSDRTEDEIALIVQECIGEVEHRGKHDRGHWIRVGMAIHSVLPGDKGLKFWSDWSSEDPEFQHEWEHSNPCIAEWRSFKPGEVGLGTLIFYADEADPKRKRFSQASLDIVEAAEAAAKRRGLDHSTLIQRAKEILELDNPSEINHLLNNLAFEANYRDKGAIEQLLLSQLEYERKKNCVSWYEMAETDYKKNYLIPDILPHPSVVLLYGAGGDGKSMTAWTIAKHIAMGLPFVVRGQLMPVKQGPVLILNGDQSESLIQDQLLQVEMPKEAPVHIQHGWQLKQYNAFCKLMDELKPALVIIDSLIGCSGGDAFDENRSEFASPLYWLSKNNGVVFPATSIIVIHHANKNGGFRGTSSIRDSVDETWAMKRPDEKSELSPNCRVVNIEKSRSGRSGTSLLMTMEDDLTYTVTDFVPKEDDHNKSPDKIIDRVLNRLRSIYPRTLTRAELERDELVVFNKEGKGSVTAVKKALERLRTKGLVESLPGKSRDAGEGKDNGGGKPVNHWRSIGLDDSLACGEPLENVPLLHSPVVARKEQWDNYSNTEKKGHCYSNLGRSNDPLSVEPEACPIANPSGEQGSGAMGHSEQYPPAREERLKRVQSALARCGEFWKDPEPDKGSVTPMTLSESIRHGSDFENCVDVPVVEVREDEIKTQNKLVSKSLNNVIDV